MSKERIARRWTASATAVGTFNLVMLLAGTLVLILTETSWNRCWAEVDQGRLSASEGVCETNLINGQASVLLLLVLCILGDFAFALWLRKRRSARMSGPATSTALWLCTLGACVAAVVGVVMGMWV